MKNIVNSSLFFLLIVTFVAQASEIDGKWKGTVKSWRGEMEYLFEFNSDGEELTGTVTTSRGENQIQNGSINGNRIEFETMFNGNPVSNNGALTGNTLFLYLGPFDSEIICERVESDTPAFDGRWLGKLAGPDGNEMELHFIFNVKDDGFSGKVESMMGDMPMINTKLEGETFSFDVDLQGMVISHRCTLQPDGTILMKYTGMEGEDELVINKMEVK